MKVRRVAAVLLCICVGVVRPGAGSHAAAGSNSAARIGAVTVRGVFERLFLDSSGVDQIQYAVHGVEGTWWLDGLAEPTPAPGSVVEVTGTPADRYTLVVDAIRAVREPGDTDAISVSAAAPRSTRILVMRVYWDAHPPAWPNAATAKRAVITHSQTWFREVSHGRYSVSGTVTPWLKVAQPTDCLRGSQVVHDQARAAARAAGYRVSSYGRFVVYLFCPAAGSIMGIASMPGTNVTMFGNLMPKVVIHEQGHNLGLRHASSRRCTNPTWGRVTWSARCQFSEYGDLFDTMGSSFFNGHFNAYYKAGLGWLQNWTTVTSTRRVTLAPFETTGPGRKAIRIAAGTTGSFWLEYRTRPVPHVPGTEGVQIRYVTNEQTEVLDAIPVPGPEDEFDVHLPAGSSWTTPQNVRITVTEQTPSDATVAIRFHAPAAAPNAPAPVNVQPLVYAARINWTRPADNGSIIRRYTITRSSDGATKTVTTIGGHTASYTWANLNPNISYRFSVRAVNQAGTSVAATSPAVRPSDGRPSVALSSPAQGATVNGVVPIVFTASPDPLSPGSGISYVYLYVDDNLADSDEDSPWGPFEWDSRGVPDGPHTIKVVVYDDYGLSTAATRTVTVSNQTTATINQPPTGATVDGAV